MNQSMKAVEPIYFSDYLKVVLQHLNLRDNWDDLERIKRQISIEKLSFLKKLPLLKRETSASAAVPLKWGHSSFQSNWKHEMRN